LKERKSYPKMVNVSKEQLALVSELCLYVAFIDHLLLQDLATAKITVSSPEDGPKTTTDLISQALGRVGPGGDAVVVVEENVEPSTNPATRCTPTPKLLDVVSQVKSIFIPSAEC
jgi:hypothetical protein